MQVINVEAQERNNFGKSFNKQLRKDGRIPAVIYSKDGVKHCSVTHADVKHLVYTPDFKLAEIKVGANTAKCTLKEIQFHPVTDAIEHMDFLELIEGHPVKIELPVKFKGTSPGVIAGGKLMQSLRKVKVKCIPSAIVDELYVDISELELGFAVRIKDIDFPEGVEVMSEVATPVASVEVPRALKSAAADEDGEAATPEAEAAAPVAE